jgi:hypothetical protein
MRIMSSIRDQLRLDEEQPEWRTPQAIEFHPQPRTEGDQPARQKISINDDNLNAAELGALEVYWAAKKLFKANHMASLRRRTMRLTPNSFHKDRLRRTELLMAKRGPEQR